MKLLLVLLSIAAITVSAEQLERKNGGGGSGGSSNPDQAACSATGGTFMTGTVSSSTPRFASGSYRDGVELSHTHVNLVSDADGKTYDIAIDNVYADGYDYAGESVPAPLTTLTKGKRLELCGESFPGGLHWVHNDCGDASSGPNGWTKVIGANGQVGPNLEESTEYCYLWQ